MPRFMWCCYGLRWLHSLSLVFIRDISRSGRICIKWKRTLAYLLKHKIDPYVFIQKAGRRETLGTRLLMLMSGRFHFHRGQTSKAFSFYLVGFYLILSENMDKDVWIVSSCNYLFIFFFQNNEILFVENWPKLFGFEKNYVGKWRRQFCSP